MTSKSMLIIQSYTNIIREDIDEYEQVQFCHIAYTAMPHHNEVHFMEELRISFKYSALKYNSKTFIV